MHKPWCIWITVTKFCTNPLYHLADFLCLQNVVERYIAYTTFHISLLFRAPATPTNTHCASQYNLRHRPHNRLLCQRASRLTDCNFIIRMLYIDWLYVYFTALCYLHVEVRFDISVIKELIDWIDWLIDCYFSTTYVLIIVNVSLRFTVYINTRVRSSVSARTH